MAGGSGTRFWPLSRKRRPKQLLRLIDGQSLLQEACRRLLGVVAAEDLYVITLADHLPAVAEQLPELPAQNLIGEPVGRDTANAVALAAAILNRQHPNATMGVFTADHLIRPADKFAEIVRRGYDAAEAHPDALVTFGIKPTQPHAGMGYLQRGSAINPGVWAVQSFKEKPDLETAKRYVAAGDHYWNSGMFVWQTDTILDQLRTHLPDTHAAAMKLADAWNTAAGQALARQIYPTLPRTSIDFAVMEKAAKVLMLEMDLEWLDVGHWTALATVLGKDGQGNTAAAKNAVVRGGKGNILVSEDDHLIAAVGVDDLVIVHGPDATLVCRRDQLDQIKELVADLDRRYGGRYS
jgi:mannose-1-phosphate guanylyltransferase